MSERDSTTGQYVSPQPPASAAEPEPFDPVPSAEPVDEQASPPRMPPPVDPATFPAHLLAVVESMHAALEGIGIATHWRVALEHLKNARAALEAGAPPPEPPPTPAVDTGK